MDSQYRIRQLGIADSDVARATFALMARVFDEADTALSDAYIDWLLARPDFLAFAAVDGSSVVGGLTAHVVPLTTRQRSEVFIYDIAVATEHRRRGIGRRLLEAVRIAARGLGIETVFVLADNEDAHALDFYRAVGGAPSSVTLFEFGDR